MFLIDDLLLAPVNGFKFIMRQIQQLAIKARQLEALGQVHTADTSSMVIEAGGDEASGDFYEPGGGR